MFNKRKKTDINPEAIYIRKTGLFASLLRMGLFLLGVMVLLTMLSSQLRTIFNSSKILNTFILTVFVFGMFLNFKNTIVLINDSTWINNFFAGKEDSSKAPKIISPVAFLLKEHRKSYRPYLEAGTMRTLLDIVDARLHDSKESSSYFSGVLVFLGLLGTFWGLLLTIGSFGDIVRNLNVSGGDILGVFESLKTNISRPLSGMGTAFSTSLFGLGSSLVLGFLQLQATLAQHFFYNELEENMTRYTRIVSASSLAEGDGSIITYLQAMLEQTADNINILQKTVMKSVDTNEEVAKKMAIMAEESSKLAKQMQEKLKLMEKISVAPEKLYPVLNDLVKISKSGFGMDDKTRNHIKNMDLGLSDMTDKISSDIRLLAKTIAMTDGKNKNDKK